MKYARTLAVALTRVSLCVALGLWPGAPAMAAEPSDIAAGLSVALPGGTAQRVNLTEAMTLLNIPLVSIALIDQDQVAWAKAYGLGATPETLFQAASLSKFVTAVGAMRLIDRKRITLDEDVNTRLTSWKVPDNDFDREHPVTLRGLLSMTAGINVPGFPGYAVGAPLPSLVQILDGTPPANSPPVTVIAVPGSSYQYSGGGYEIAEALMADVAGTPFVEAMDRLVLAPAEMRHSTFAQPLAQPRQRMAAKGHFADGKEVPGGFHIIPEHAAGGLWSTPSDVAQLAIVVGRAWRGESHLFLRPETAREMMTPQAGGPYGLGAAISGKGAALVLEKRGQNVGYQSYLILFPARGQGMVVMTNSDNGSILAEALIRRAGAAYGWPPLGPLPD